MEVQNYANTDNAALGVWGFGKSMIIVWPSSKSDKKLMQRNSKNIKINFR
jgi:hypothetical protein